MPSIALWCPHCRAYVGAISVHQVLPGPQSVPIDPALLVRRLDEFVVEGWNRPIDKLSKRTYNALLNDNINTIADLLPHSEADLLRLPNLGRRGINEIKATLASLGLQLCMVMPEARP